MKLSLIYGLYIYSFEMEKVPEKPLPFQFFEKGIARVQFFFAIFGFFFSYSYYIIVNAARLLNK